MGFFLLLNITFQLVKSLKIITLRDMVESETQAARAELIHSLFNIHSFIYSSTFDFVQQQQKK
jgi:hypothetical protein